MINKVIQSKVNLDGTYKSAILGTVTALIEFTTTIQLISPIQLQTAIMVNFLVYDARNENISLFMQPTNKKGADVSNDVDVANWNVWEVDIDAVALSKISKYRAGRIGISYTFYERTTSNIATNYLGLFDSYDTIPTAVYTQGDYFVCNAYNVLYNGLLFNYQDNAVYHNGKWIKDKNIKLILTTATQDLAVDPSLLANVPDVVEQDILDIIATWGQAFVDTLDLKPRVEDLELKTASMVNTSDIVNDLVSTDTDKPLSAYQGLVLNNKIFGIAGGRAITIANDYGASPSNPDNTMAIQEALDKKGIVYIRNQGIYNCGRLYIDSDTTLVLGDGVVLRRKDLTNHHLITNKGHVMGYRNRNISLIGGEIDFNISGQNADGSGSLATDTQAWAQIGILFHNIDNLTISNIKKIGNESKYCFLICDVNGFVADSIIFDNESDGLHFQPPFSNARITNIGGWCEDDTISFTNGDYATYALGNYGNMENVIIENIVGGQKGGVYTDQLVKVVGSGMDGLSKFKNFTIRNLSGGVSHHAIHIMGADDGDGESRLSSTHIENFIVENVDVELGFDNKAYIRCNANSGDIVIRNVNVKQNTKAFFNFQEAGLKSVVLDGVFNYDAPETPISGFNAVIIASGQIEKMVLNNINLKLDVTNGNLLYRPSGLIKQINISNSKLDMNNQIVFGFVGEDESSLNIENSIINGNIIVGASSKINVRVTSSLITPVLYGAYLDNGAEISVLLDDNSIFNNFNINSTSELRKIRLNGKGLIYKKDLSTINNAKYGDIITSGGSTETLLGLVMYENSTWFKYRMSQEPQGAWITPTLLNGATGTIQYMKDTLGFVHFRGNVKMPVGGASNFMIMPVGYRVNEIYRLPVWDNVKNIVGQFIILTNGSCYVESGVGGSEFNGTIMNITYQGV